MANLQDIINLAKADGGKFFVMDKEGDAKLVIMGIDEYERLLVGKLKKQVEDIEKINREILKAQLHEPEIIKPVTEVPVRGAIHEVSAPERHPMPIFDLREEVIDPTFDFEGPKIDLEEI